MNIPLTPQDAERLARVTAKFNSENIGHITSDEMARLVLTIALQDRCAQLDQYPREQMG